MKKQKKVKWNFEIKNGVLNEQLNNNNNNKKCALTTTTTTTTFTISIAFKK